MTLTKTTDAIRQCYFQFGYNSIYQHCRTLRPMEEATRSLCQVLPNLLPTLSFLGARDWTITYSKNCKTLVLMDGTTLLGSQSSHAVILSKLLFWHLLLRNNIHVEYFARSNHREKKYTTHVPMQRDWEKSATFLRLRHKL